MKSRALLFGLAGLLVGAAIVVERYATAVPEIRSDGAEASGPGGSAPGASVQSPHEFAILELGMGEVPECASTFRFHLVVTDGAGPATEYDVEPIQTGLVQFGPLRAGGAICGFDDEETVGEARLRVAATLGRQFVVIPVRKPTFAVRRHRVEVVDADEWPVEGARILCDGATPEARTSALGYAPIDATASPRVQVVPPKGRPDLLEQEARLDAKTPMTLVKLASRPGRDVRIPELTADLARAPIDRVRIEPADARNVCRELDVRDGLVCDVPIGTHRVGWDVEGMRREGLLTVSPDGVAFEDSGRPLRLTTVEVGGAWQAFAAVPMQLVVLAARTRRSFLNPSRILNSSMYEALDGLNFTTFGRFGDVRDDGSVVFPGVAPGCYEFEIVGRPRFASLCIVVPESGAPEVVRRVARPIGGVGTLYGTVTGPAGSKPYHVEVRAIGQFESTKLVQVGDSYEFGDLSPGVYAVRVVRSDSFAVLRATGAYPASAWRNVIVDAGLRVKLDFTVE